ncbi:very short patch repair endonuclease [bacterium CG1_02_42_9]|nr:MAG: very short patch repair endonuclease [bacterium CG1_02_42_9]
MTDFVSKEKRSKIMSAIRSKGNETTEIALMRLFRQNQIVGWRRNYLLHGKPDFVFPKDRVVVFVDGCFWHGHTCLKPRDSLKKGFWKEKIERNRARDKLVSKSLIKEGWKVVRVWECEIEKGKYRRKFNFIMNYLEISRSKKQTR